MVKFQKQMERQLVAEWREVYCNYKQLKQQVKVIKEDRIKQHLQIATGSGGLQAGRDQHPSQLQKADSVGVPPSWSFANFARHIRVRGENLVVVHNKRIEACGVDEELYETELLGPFSGAQHEKDFFARLDAQLNQVNRFYKHKEEEYIFQSRQLVNQVDSLVEMKKASSTENSETGPSIHENQKRYIKDMKGDYRKCALDGLALCKHRRKLAEKMLQVAFLEFYRGLELLKGYSSLNLMAFAKILKKYDKVTGQETADTYLRAVRTSYFTSSNQA